MASVLAFDTHAYIKKLRDAGVTEEQAEIQTEVLVALLDGFLASRRELAEQEISLKRDIKALDVKLETRTQELKRDIKELDVKLETRSKELEAQIKALEVELKRDIKELDSKLETRFKELDIRLKELETRLLTRLGSLLFIGIGLLATLMKLL